MTEWQGWMDDLAPLARAEGVSMTDILLLPDAARAFMLWFVQRGEVSVAEVAERANLPLTAAEKLLEWLAVRGIAASAAESPDRFMIRLSSRPQRLRAGVERLWNSITGEV